MNSFINGVASAPISFITNGLVQIIATSAKLIPDNPCFFYHEYLGNLQRLYPNIFHRQNPGWEFEAWKRAAVSAIIDGGILEELFFRGLIQDLLLKRLLGKAIMWLAPGQTSLMDSTLAKIFRISLTAGLFGGAHVISGEGSWGSKYQAFNAMLDGGILGILKESRGGLMSCIGHHMMVNATGMNSMLYYCVRV